MGALKIFDGSSVQTVTDVTRFKHGAGPQTGALWKYRHGSTHLLLWPTSIPQPTGLTVVLNASTPNEALDVSCDALPESARFHSYVFRRWTTDPGAKVEAAEIDRDSTPAFTDDELGGNTTFSYDVVARLYELGSMFDVALESLASSSDSETTDHDPITSAPTGVSFGPKADSSTAIEGSWTAPPDALTYDIQQAPDDSNSPNLGAITLVSDDQVAESIEIGSLSPNTPYWQRVAGTNPDSTGPYTSWVKATTHIDRPTIDGTTDVSVAGQGRFRFDLLHLNAAANARGTEIRYRTKSGGGAYGSETAVTGGTATVDVDVADAADNYVQFRYLGESVYSEVGPLEPAIPE